MKKRALVSLVLLTFVTAGAAFAQSATLDKLTFTAKKASGKDYYEVKALNTSISGAVVIPGTYNNVPVTTIPSAAFDNCKNITSVTIPASVTSIGGAAFRGCTGLTDVTIPNTVTQLVSNTFINCTGLKNVTIPASVTSIGQAFRGCTNLTSVTFGGSSAAIPDSASNSSFPGDLAVAYKAGGAGTYTRPANGANWTKQGAASAPAVNTSLDGYWRRDSGMTIIVSGNSAIINSVGETSSPLSKDAVNKGYFKTGTQYLRNLRSTGNLTWSGEILGVTSNDRSPNVATGTGWANVTITMSADGRTLSFQSTVNDDVWTRWAVQ